jgi:hypothetical protein
MPLPDPRSARLADRELPLHYGKERSIAKSKSMAFS